MKPLAALKETVTDFGDALGIGSQRRQQEFSAKEAQKQREWQEYMSNTAHQRQVADLQAAGLNPILSVTNGMSGASVPTGSSGQGSMSAKSGNGLKDLAHMVSKIIFSTAKAMR